MSANVKEYRQEQFGLRGSVMSRRYDLGVGLAVLIAVALACANAEPVFRLDASRPDSTSVWVQGRQILTQTVDSVTVSVAYERTTGTHHVFRVLVRNRGDSTFTIDPARSSARFSTARLDADSLDAIPEPVVSGRIPARNPETQILEADLEKSRADARAANEAMFDLLVATADVAEDVHAAASGGRTPEARAADAAEDTERIEAREERARERRATVNAYRQQRRQWSSRALRKTTLPPGTHAGGRLYVPLQDDARTVELRVAAGPHVVSFFYHQIRYDPNEGRSHREQ
jgi:hypothetical protein